MPRTRRVNPSPRKVFLMNAANNLALTYIGPAVADHDRHAMNEPATKQDLYNMGVHIDSSFGKVISQFTIVDSQFTNLRAEISEQFSKVYILIEKSKSETRALLSKSTAANILLMVAILSIDRWWR